MGCSGDVGVGLCSAPWLCILLSCGNLWLYTSVTNQGAEINPKHNVQLRLVTEELYYPLNLDLRMLPLLRSCKSTVTTPLQCTHRWEVATWLCLPFNPKKSVLLARCLPLTWIQTIIRASIINPVLTTAFIPRAGELLGSTIISAACHWPLQLTKERTVSNCCVTHTIMAILQLLPYHSYRGLVMALSPTCVYGCRPASGSWRKAQTGFQKANTKTVSNSIVARHRLDAPNPTCKRYYIPAKEKWWAAISPCCNTCQITLTKLLFLLKPKWVLICTCSSY